MSFPSPLKVKWRVVAQKLSTRGRVEDVSTRKVVLKKTSYDVEFDVKWRVVVQKCQQDDDLMWKFVKKKTRLCQKIIKGIILPPTRTSHHFRWYLSPTEVNESAHFRQTTTQCFPRYRAVPTRWTGSTPLGITSSGTTGTYNQRPHSCFPPRSVPPQTGTPTYWTGSTPTGKS